MIGNVSTGKAHGVIRGFTCPRRGHDKLREHSVHSNAHALFILHALRLDLLKEEFEMRPHARLGKRDGRELGKTESAGHRVDANALDVRPEVIPMATRRRRAVDLRHAAVHEQRLPMVDRNCAICLGEVPRPAEGVDQEVAILTGPARHKVFPAIERARLGAHEGHLKLHRSRCRRKPKASGVDVARDVIPLLVISRHVITRPSRIGILQ